MGGIVGAVGSIAGGLLARSGAKKAASAQTSAANKGIAFQEKSLEETLKLQREALAQERSMYDEAISLGKPYRDSGQRALAQYEQLLYGYSPSSQALDSGQMSMYDFDAYSAAMAKYKADQEASGGRTQIKFSAGTPQKVADFYNQRGYLQPKHFGKLSTEDRAQFEATPEGRKFLRYQEKPGGGIQAPQITDFKFSAGAEGAESGTGSVLQPEELTTARRDALLKSPGYQFAFDEGAKALERGASARSGMLSGAQSKALTRFGQNIGLSQYDSFMDRIGALATQGANVAVGSGSMAVQSGANRSGILQNMGTNIMQNAGNVGSLMGQAGAAQASGYLGQSAATTGMFNNIAGAFGQGGFGGGMYGGGSGNYGSLGTINWFPN